MNSIILGIIWTVVGGLIGYLIGNSSKVKDAGIFLIDDTDSEKTKWTLDVHMDPDDIPKKKHLRFKVYVQK